MDYSEDISKVKELLEKSTDIIIATHEHPTADSVGSSLALLLGLTSLDKKVTLVCPEPMTVGLSNFIGVDKFKTELNKKNFIISLDYVDGSIEKVSYNIEGNKFNLVVEPREGFEAFSEEKVHFIHGSANTQLIFTVDTIHLGGLSKLYEEDKELFAGHTVVNIDRHPNNANFGQVNLVDQSASTTAEVVAKLLSELGAELTPDIGTNLLNAIYETTNNFTSFILSPAAFEVAAVCLRAGGKRFSVTPSEETPSGETAAAGSNPGNPNTRFPRTRPQNIPGRPGVQVKYPAVTPPSQQTQTANTDQPASPLPVNPPQPGSSDDTNPAPADWLKPKIFKSSNAS